MGELGDPAKHGAHAQRLQELRAKGLVGGEAQGPIDHQGKVEFPDGPVISPSRVLEAHPIPGLLKPGVHSRREG